MTGSSAAATADRRQTRSERAIIAAARTLFLARGYDDVSTEEIAKAAGVARQTLFNRFKSKDAVFRAVIDDHWQQWGRNLPMKAPAHEAPVGDHLRAIALSVAAFQDSTQQIQFQRLIVSESRQFDWLGPAAYRAGKAPRMVALTAHFARLHAEGRLNCPNPGIAAWQFIGLIQEFLVWPKVMATGDDEAIPPVDIVIAEAIATFMARYRP
jgi:AcrR family transcriptional regulator